MHFQLLVTYATFELATWKLCIMKLINNSPNHSVCFKSIIVIFFKYSCFALYIKITTLNLSVSKLHILQFTH